MRRSSKAPLFLGIAAVALIALGVWLLGASGSWSLPWQPQRGIALAITASLVNAASGEVVQTWDPYQQSPLAIMYGNTRIDIDPSAGYYELHFQPKWTVGLTNLSGGSYYILQVKVNSVTQTWKGKSLTDVTPFGVSNEAQVTESFSPGVGVITKTLQCGKRIFDCNTVVYDPPASGATADYKITYSYTVTLKIDGNAVDTKTGTATATATFRNTGPSGTLSSVQVTVDTQLVLQPPSNVGYF